MPRKKIVEKQTNKSSNLLNRKRVDLNKVVLEMPTIVPGTKKAIKPKISENQEPNNHLVLADSIKVEKDVYESSKACLKASSAGSRFDIGITQLPIEIPKNQRVVEQRKMEVSQLFKYKELFFSLFKLSVSA